MRIMRSIVVSALASVAFLLASRADAQSDRVIDPKAQAIVERGIDAVRKLDSLELVASNSLEGPAAADRGPAADTPARWTLDFRNAPAGRPFARAVIESLEGDTVTRRVAFDGQKAISVNDAKRTFMVGPFGEVADPSVNMPGWFVDTRLGVSPVGFSPEDMSLPQLAAASVVGEETLDGLACDVVRTLRTKSIAGPPGADGTPMPSQEIRIRETIAFARADGLPRCVRLEIELSNAPPDGMASVGVFTGLKPNPPVSDAMFATVAPEGYARAEPPKRMERDAPELKIGVGDPAPAFALVDLDGREVTLASLAGHVVLLDFWATWCGPCKAAMPLIQQIHDDYRDKPVTVLGVNVAERKPDAGRAYMKEKGFTYGCLLAGEELSNAYGIRGIPTLVVIGKDGKVALLEVGLGPDGDRTLRAAIDAALAR